MVHLNPLFPFAKPTIDYVLPAPFDIPDPAIEFSILLYIPKRGRVIAASPLRKTMLLLGFDEATNVMKKDLPDLPTHFLLISNQHVLVMFASQADRKIIDINKNNVYSNVDSHLRQDPTMREMSAT